MISWSVSCYVWVLLFPQVPIGVFMLYYCKNKVVSNTAVAM